MTSSVPLRRAAALAVVSITLSGCGLHGSRAMERDTSAAQSGEALSDSLTTAFTGSSRPTTRVPIVAPGIVEPWGADVALAAQEPGWLSAILVREGDVVRGGQVVATLDEGAQHHALALARGELAEAEATWRRIQRGATDEERRQAEADLAAAEARASYARLSADRTSQLRAGGGLAADEIDRSRADATVQTALARQVEARLAEIMRGPRAEDRAVAAARLTSARARVSLAHAALGRRRVVSPIGGTVLVSRMHAGEFHDPRSGPLITLGDLSRLQVRLEVDEVDARDVAPGARTVLLGDGGERLGEGTVVRVAPRMGRRILPLESPTARADVRVREVFVEISASTLLPGQRVWGRMARAASGRTS